MVACALGVCSGNGSDRCSSAGGDGGSRSDSLWVAPMSPVGPTVHGCQLLTDRGDNRRFPAAWWHSVTHRGSRRPASGTRVSEEVNQAL
jgi:hypothetical protein